MRLYLLILSCIFSISNLMRQFTPAVRGSVRFHKIVDRIL